MLRSKLIGVARTGTLRGQRGEHLVSETTPMVSETTPGEILWFGMHLVCITKISPEGIKSRIQPSPLSI